MRAAVWGARQLDLLYPRANGDGMQWRRVEPHGLVCKAGVWYLVAYCQMRRDFRTFKVARIEDVVVRDETTTPRPGFDLQTYWEESRRRFEEQMRPYALTLRVAPTAQRSLLGEGVTLREEPDGYAVMRFDTESQSAAISLALSLGADVEVLSPPQVRAAVAEAGRAIAALYARPATREAVSGIAG